jgi:Uncharacterized protein conserved in bacteria (DUF2252)
MSVESSTAKYEQWLQERLKPNQEIFDFQIKKKHKAMADDPFQFLRATFYRWAELWPKECTELASQKEDVVFAIGDLHAENFGTWRDAQGRLVWGVNDFDEACRLPFTHDLVRLATSAFLATDEDHLSISNDAICQCLVDGYANACRAGGGGFILDSAHQALRLLINDALETANAKTFWEDLQDEDDYPLVTSKLPIQENVAGFLSDSLPTGAKVTYRIVRKGKGLGSLGRPRFVALTEWKGGFVGREAKALVPSAVEWLNDPQSTEIGAEATLKVAIRSPDPWYQIRQGWVIRLSAPDAVKVDLKKLGKQVNEDSFARTLLKAMGWEAANIHLGSKEGPKLLKRLENLQSKEKAWLQNAAERMRDMVKDDFKTWRNSRRSDYVVS